MTSFMEEESSLPMYGKRKGVLTNCLALDTESVGVGDGGYISMVARVSIVNEHGECVYDTFVLPQTTVVDYRTRYSGIRPECYENAKDLPVVRCEVLKILRGRILVGHAVHNDLQVLMISHPTCLIIDISNLMLFRSICGGRTPALKHLAAHFLGVQIQVGEHNSVVDARTTMHLFQWFKETAAAA